MLLISVEYDNEVEPHLTLNTVAPGQMNARNVINANIQNTKPMLVNQLSIDAKISRKGSSEVLYHSEKKMHPNSNFNYPIQLEGQPLEAGIQPSQKENMDLDERFCY